MTTSGEMRGEELRKVGPKAGGSLPGFLAEHVGSGERWLVKLPARGHVARNEVLAARLYSLAGVPVPEVRLVRWQDGRIGVASRFMPGLRTAAERLRGREILPGVHDAFAVDAWLANWDVVGLAFDNIGLVDGRWVRIDVGGALRYRAMGAPKGPAFGPTVSELSSMCDPAVNPQASAVFRRTPHPALEVGVRRVLGIADEAIRDAVQRFGPEEPDDRARL